MPIGRWQGAGSPCAAAPHTVSGSRRARPGHSPVGWRALLRCVLVALLLGASLQPGDVHAQIASTPPGGVAGHPAVGVAASQGAGGDTLTAEASAPVAGAGPMLDGAGGAIRVEGAGGVASRQLDAVSGAPSRDGAPPIPSVSAPVPSGNASGGSSDAAGEGTSHAVRVGDHDIVVLRVPVASKSAEERARQANKAFAALASNEELPEIEVLVEGTSAGIYANRKLLLRLYPVDARASVDDGEPPSLEDFAERVATDTRWALSAERTRGQVANSVLAVSLVVLFALIAFFLMRRLAVLGQSARVWIDDHEDKLRLRVRDLEILGPEALQSASVIGLSLVAWVGQVAIVYTWLVASLSLFPATREYTRDLTGLIFRPVSDLATRIAGTLPGLFVAGVAALVVFLLVRFVSLFFASVAKRENTLTWVAPDLALQVSVLLRFAIITAALLFATPIVTGDPNGTLPRLGVAVLGALALASTPVLASGIVGSLAVLRRRLRVGDFVSIGDLTGRVVRLSLLEVRLVTAEGHDARIPAFRLLHTPLVRLGERPVLTAELRVAFGVSRAEVERLLLEAARSVGTDPAVELRAASASGYSYRISATCSSLGDRGRLLAAAVDAVLDAGMALARVDDGSGQR